jgi:RHS repeat-associated protein
VTTYAYDALNRLVSITDPLGYTTVYTYDAVGNRVGQTRPDGTVITYTYDALDRLVGTHGPGLAIWYAYDAVGNRAVMTDTVGVTRYGYDALNRLVEVTGPGGTVRYGYDAVGNRTSLTYPGGEVVTYTYDLADRLTHVADWAGRAVTYTYDAAGRQTLVQYPNGTEAAYTYDNADRLLSVVHTSAVSGTIAAFTYTLDAVGNRLAMRDLEGTTTYGYDALYRLVQVTYPDGERVDYAYDRVGNRTAMTSTVSGAILYTYDAGDRLLTAGSDSFGWDANGRQVTRTFGVDTATYTFDPLDRLTQVVSGTTTVLFTYNGDGVRVGKSVDGTGTQYVQDVGAPLPVVLVETTGGQAAFYLYGNGLVARVDGTGTLLFYHMDGLGSVRALSNLAGQRVDAYTYDAFGALRHHDGETDQPFTFTGEQGDGEVGLVYLRARSYDPSTGRFLTEDALQGLLATTQDQNKYVYSGNNPVLHTDRTGLDYTYLKTRVAGFYGLGGALALGLYTDVETGQSRLVLEPEVGGGVGARFTTEAGVSTGALPTTGVDLRANVSAGSIAQVGVSGRMDLLTGDVSMAVSPVLPAKIGMSGRGEVALAVQTGAGLEASGTLGGRIVLADWQRGALGDWLFNLLLKPGLDREYEMLKLESLRLRMERTFREKGWWLDSEGVWRPPTVQGGTSPFAPTGRLGVPPSASK